MNTIYTTVASTVAAIVFLLVGAMQAQIGSMDRELNRNSIYLGAIAICVNEVETGNAYGPELLTQCVNDYLEMDR